MKEMPIKLKIYILFIISLGLISLYNGFKIFKIEMIPMLIFFTVLGVIAEATAIKLNNNIYFSVNFGVGLASVLVFQSPIVAIIGFFSMILVIERIDGQIKHLFNTPIYKKVFNGSVYAISLTMATITYNIMCNHFDKFKFLDFNVFGIILAIICYVIINLLMFVILLSIIQNRPLIKLIYENIWLVINVIAISPLGIFIAVISKQYGLFPVFLFFGPLLLARYSFKLYLDMKKNLMETIEALSNAMDAKDKYTNGHSYRVSDYAVGVARTMGYSEGKLERIKIAAILHDIGKIGIKDTILNKPGKLEAEEFTEIKRHPEIGAHILENVENLSEVTKIIRYHHERYDGKGYPESIGGDDVPMESYILAVSDAFDAMTSDRPYRKAMDVKTAKGIILEEKGKQFNPIVVDAFMKYINNNKEQSINVC